MYLSLRALLVVSLLSAFLILFVDAAVAENNVGISIEWIVADSDMIVRGHITDVKVEQGIGQWRWETATVRVTETLKGEKNEEISFITSNLNTHNMPSIWKNEGVEMLICLVKSERYHQFASGYKKSRWALIHDGNVYGAFRLNDKPANPVFTMDFNILAEKSDILQAVKRAVEISGGDVKPVQFRIEVPYSSEAHGKLFAGSAVHMVVPVDSALEGLARKWVRSEDLDLRRDAVRALGHFENDENIALVRKMLDDPGFYISGASRIYDVRKAAYAVLQKWGVDAAEPIVEEPVTQKRREPEQESAEDDSPQSAPASNDTFPYLVILVVVVIVVSACVALLLLRRRNSP